MIKFISHSAPCREYDFECNIYNYKYFQISGLGFRFRIFNPKKFRVSGIPESDPKSIGSGSGIHFGYFSRSGRVRVWIKISGLDMDLGIPDPIAISITIWEDYRHWCLIWLPSMTNSCRAIYYQVNMAKYYVNFYLKNNTDIFSYYYYFFLHLLFNIYFVRLTKN